MRRTTTVLAGALLALGLAAGPAAATTEDPIVTVPICDLDGHCDRQCTVYSSVKNPVRCGW